jgi:uncharacterized protein (TIGR02596 family)
MEPMMKKRGFSLIELLAVVAVLGILLVLVTTAFNSIATSSSITQSTNLISGQIELARQLAAVRNRTIELRFLKKTGEPFSALQLWWPGLNQSAEKPVVLPQGTLLNESLSPWLSTMANGTVPVGAWSNATYRSFAIRPSGALEPPPAAASRTNLFLTISAREEANPSNYATIQVNPDTSRPILYRP